MSGEPREVSEDVAELVSRKDLIESQEKLIRKQVEVSTRNILRAFSLNPVAVNVIKKDAVRNGRTKRFLKHATELREVVLHKLLTSPVELEERLGFLKDVSEKEVRNTTAVGKLELLLKAAQQKKDEEVLLFI